MDSRKKVVIAGGGLVGALNAVYMAQRGYEVHVYDIRPDPREEEASVRVSINLALSVRGVESLRAAGCAEEILSKGIPMYARKIHNLDGTLVELPYGRADQCILSIDRCHLNRYLLTVAAQHPNVHLHFRAKCTEVNCAAGSASFTHADGTSETVKADLVCGNDGTHSRVRAAIMRATFMDYSQSILSAGYKELSMPPTADGAHRMASNVLHIWPRGSFMMIALPNLDGSFTMTLFLPHTTFNSLVTPEDVLAFFRQYFPDAIPLMGQEHLLKEYFENPSPPLTTIKCSPYHAQKAVIFGDAAHAMVPFYGQGMNCMLDKHNDDIPATLAEFSAERPKDCQAMCDLALYNFIEMRDSVNSRYFRFRKSLDGILNWLMPSRYIPLYSMVTFSRIPYATVVARHKAQYASVTTGLQVTGAVALGAIAYAALKYGPRASASLSALLKKF